MIESCLLDSCVVLELMFLKEKKSRQEMREVIAKFQQYQIAWPAPEKCNEIFTLLADKYHSERNPDGTFLVLSKT